MATIKFDTCYYMPATICKLQIWICKDKYSFDQSPADLQKKQERQYSVVFLVSRTCVCTAILFSLCSYNSFYYAQLRFFS